MNRLLLRLTDDQVNELNWRLLGRQELQIVRYPELEGEDVFYMDPTGNVDGVIARALGTLVQLDDHQRAGGTIILGYGDGSERELTVDLERDGVELPVSRRARWRRPWPYGKAMA